MLKIKSITEDKYTLNDIFTKHYEFWLVLPLLVYLLTPVVHMVIYAFLYTDEMNEQTLTHYIATGENPGDYYSPIIHFAFLIGAFLTIIALVSTVAYAKQNKKKFTIDAIPALFFAVYVMLIIASTLANKVDKNLLFGYTARSEGVLSVLAYFFVYYLCASFVKNEKYKNLIILFFLCTSTVIGILTLIDKYIIDIPIIGVSDDRVCGIFYNFNFYAYYITITVMLCASLVAIKEKIAVKIFAFIVFCINVFLLAINDTFGAFLACLVGFVFLIIAASVYKRKVNISSIVMLLVFLGIIFIVGLFVPSYFSEILSFGKDVGKIVTDSQNAGDAGTARWTLWTHTAQYIREKPWLGWGFEGTTERLATETHASKAHNEYLENMAYYGIPAGVIYVLGLMAIYIKALVKRHNVDASTICCLTAALGYIASAFVGNSMIFISPFFFIFLGLANNTQLKKVNENKENELDSADSDEEINKTEEIAVTE